MTRARLPKRLLVAVLAWALIGMALSVGLHLVAWRLAASWWGVAP